VRVPKPPRDPSLHLKVTGAQFYPFTNSFQQVSGVLVRVSYTFDCPEFDTGRPWTADGTSLLVQGGTSAVGSATNDPDLPTREGSSGMIDCLGKGTRGYSFFDPAGFDAGPASFSLHVNSCTAADGCQQLSGQDTAVIGGTRPAGPSPKPKPPTPVAQKPGAGPTAKH
jgi:hypothetical protein